LSVERRRWSFGGSADNASDSWSRKLLFGGARLRRQLTIFEDGVAFFVVGVV